MHTGVAVQALQDERIIENALALWIVLVGGLEFGIVRERLVEGDLGILGHHLGEVVAFGQGDFQHAADIANARLGAE